MKVINIKDSEISFERASRIVLVVVLGIILFSYYYVKEVYAGSHRFSEVQETVQLRDQKPIDSEGGVPKIFEGTTSGNQDQNEIRVGIVTNNGKKESINRLGKLNSNIDRFVATYNGSRMNKSYLKVLRDTCKNEKTLELVVAVSVSETGMGRDTSNGSNFWGFFKGGNRGYDPSREQMAKDICKSFSGYYSDVYKNKAKASRYTGEQDSSGWRYRVNWAMDKM